MDFLERKAIPNQVLLFSCQDACIVANDVVSHRMSLDYKYNMTYSQPEQNEDGQWYLPDPIYQCDTQEQYDRYMAQVMDYENAIQALLEVVA